MVDIAPQLHEISTSETRAVSVDMRGKLDGAEVCTGTPTITEVATSTLTLGSKAVSSAILTINGDSVPIGQAIQFTVAGSAAGIYAVDIVCGTDAGQTVHSRIRVIVC